VGEKINALPYEERGVLIKNSETYKDLLRVSLGLLLSFYKPADKDIVEYSGEEEKKEEE
jgi:hypothetical protein